MSENGNGNGNGSRVIKVSNEAYEAFKQIGEALGIHKGGPVKDKETGLYLIDERTGQPVRNVNISKTIDVVAQMLAETVKTADEQTLAEMRKHADAIATAMQARRK